MQHIKPMSKHAFLTSGIKKKRKKKKKKNLPKIKYIEISFSNKP